jgi:membrane associated rhomboid family serine protease
MILIPIGHDHGELRRWPVVTFAILGLCVGVAFFDPGTSRSSLRAARQAFTEALRFYQENPDLTADSQLRQAFDEALATQDAGLRRQMQKYMKQREGDESTRAERQARLDDLTRRWLVPIHDNAIWRWGLIPADFSWVKVFTSMFVHAGFFHLLFNMLFLYMTGPFIEDVWGRPLFAALYLVGGAFAGLMFVAADPHLDVPLVGASGAVAAVMGAFLVRYPRAKIRLLTFVLWRRVVFSAPAWVLLSIWFAGEYLESRSVAAYTPLGGGGMKVANWVHVCGFGFGAAVAGVIRFFGLEERYLYEAIEREREAQRDPFQARLDQLLAKGETAEACRWIAAELLRRPSDIELAELYWHLARLGPMASQPSVCLRIVDSDLAAGREDLALERWSELQRATAAVEPDTRLAVRLARCLRDNGRPGDAESLLVGHYRQMTPSTSPQEWAEMAEYCAAAGSPIASQVISRALAHPRLAPEARASLQQVLRLQSGI